jgi:hypothetical protein
LTATVPPAPGVAPAAHAVAPQKAPRAAAAPTLSSPTLVFRLAAPRTTSPAPETTLTRSHSHGATEAALTTTASPRQGRGTARPVVEAQSASDRASVAVSSGIAAAAGSSPPPTASRLVAAAAPVLAALLLALCSAATLPRSIPYISLIERPG